MKKEQPKKTLIFCPEEISSLPGIKEYINSDSFLNKYGGPVWMDFSPGSYVNKNGEEVYKSSHKCEYVDKELIRVIIDRMKNSQDKGTFDKYQVALEYFINN